MRTNSNMVALLYNLELYIYRLALYTYVVRYSICLAFSPSAGLFNHFTMLVLLKNGNYKKYSLNLRLQLRSEIITFLQLPSDFQCDRSIVLCNIY